MNRKIVIQGIACEYRDVTLDEEILYSGLPNGEQYFKIQPHPFTDDEMVDIANKEHKYTSSQMLWKEREEKRFTDGVYAYIDGVLKFLPGAYWCYINYWKLENGESPEYREDDRIFFLFHEYLRLQTDSLGVTRLKGRRQGATSIAMFFMWFIGGREEFKNCGLTSFSDTAAGDAFRLMFMFGFKSLLPCFQADFDSDAENFIRFVKPVDKKKKSVLAVKREGLNSYCNYKSNVINSYDSGRQSYNVMDESGKRNKLDINSYWSRLYKTMLIGSNKVGFCYSPTTVGAKTEGGEDYQLFYKNADQYKLDRQTGLQVGINTDNRMVRYFVPAHYCYKGYIDKFGNSIADDPDEPVLTNEGKYVSEGAKTVLLRERQNLEGNQLMEHRRDYPLDEHDAFSFATGICEFNEENFLTQLRWLDEHKVYLRRCRLYRERVSKINILNNQTETWDEIRFMDDDKGSWLLYEKPEIENAYNHTGRLEPQNTIRYSIGVDTIKSGFSANGSTATICVFKKSHIVDGVEKGLYPVALYMGKPHMMDHQWEQVLMACLWYGCKACFEIDAGSSYYDYFIAFNAGLLLEWTPRIAIDVAAKRHPLIKPGVESANPYQFAMQLEVAKKYFDGTLLSPDYNGNVHRVVFPIILTQGIEYNHEDRTKSDVIISLMMALLPCFGSVEVTKHEQRPIQALPTYKIKLPA
jgi:hypothetical protein